MRAILFSGSDIKEIDIIDSVEALKKVVNADIISAVDLVPNQAVMIINIHGRDHQMKPNIMASSIAGQKIVGPAVAIGVKDNSFTSLPLEIARHIKTRCGI